MIKISFSYSVNRRILIRSYAEYLRRAYWPRDLPTFLCRCCVSCLLEILILNCDLTELKWSDNRQKKKTTGVVGIYSFLTLLNLPPVPRLSQVIILDNRPKKLESETLKIRRNARVQCPYTKHKKRTSLCHMETWWQQSGHSGGSTYAYSVLHILTEIRGQGWTSKEPGVRHLTN